MLINCDKSRHRQVCGALMRLQLGRVWIKWNSFRFRKLCPSFLSSFSYTKLHLISSSAKALVEEDEEEKGEEEDIPMHHQQHQNDHLHPLLILSITCNTIIIIISIICNFIIVVVVVIEGRYFLQYIYSLVFISRYNTFGVSLVIKIDYNFD